MHTGGCDAAGHTSTVPFPQSIKDYFLQMLNMFLICLLLVFDYAECVLYMSLCMSCYRRNNNMRTRVLILITHSHYSRYYFTSHAVLINMLWPIRFKFSLSQKCSFSFSHKLEHVFRRLCTMAITKHWHLKLLP